MGDMADFALDNALDEVEHFYKYQYADNTTQYEQGLIDEMGIMHESPNNLHYIKPSGPGNCPVCQSSTKLINGKFGKFYGCINFPNCKGNRNY